MTKPTHTDDFAARVMDALREEPRPSAPRSFRAALRTMDRADLAASVAVAWHVASSARGMPLAIRAQALALVASLILATSVAAAIASTTAVRVVTPPAVPSILRELADDPSDGRTAADVAAPRGSDASEASEDGDASPDVGDRDRPVGARVPALPADPVAPTAADGDDEDGEQADDDEDDEDEDEDEDDDSEDGDRDDADDEDAGDDGEDDDAPADEDDSEDEGGGGSDDDSEDEGGGGSDDDREDGDESDD